MSTINDAMNLLADHVKSHKNFSYVTNVTTIGVISGGGTKWVDLSPPTGALCLYGHYISGSGNTNCLVYSISRTSIAVKNLSSSATGSDLKFNA